MNYLIWNGVDSRSLTGLMVCELPPITKPAMRVQITEIEGRDGNISDEVGYSAYDKTMKIGLTTGFDVNAIAKYFTGSGKVIFSNEPDKYYNAEITEIIDFERLVTFRTATIKFHTQPFKHLVGEESTNLEIDSETKLIVLNQGLETSKPAITLFGEGIIELSINGYAQFQVDIDNEFLTINSEIEECYKDSLSNLKNRNMTGVFPTLKPDENIITWTGNLTKIEIQPKSRWL